MLGILNFFIGISMAALEALKNPIEGKKFIENLGISLLGASSEFIGDGTQGLIGRVADAIKQRIECKRLNNAFYENSDKSNLILLNDIKKIIKEIEEIQTNEKRERDGKRKCIQERKSNNKSSDNLKINDVRVLMKMNADLLFYENISEYLMRSEHYRQLNMLEKDKAHNIARLIEITVNTFAKDAFYKMPDDFKVLAYIITHTLKERNSKEQIQFKEEDYEKFAKELAEKLLLLVNQNGGVINPQVIANAKYAPKYIIRACPGCGYDGPRILVDEKTNSIYCAACGGTYDVLQYVEPEICTELNNKVDCLLNSNKNIQAFIKGQGEENKEQMIELKEHLKEQYKAQLTREYLDSCMKGQTDLFEKKLKEISEVREKVETDFKERISNVLSVVNSKSDDLKEELKANVSDVIETLKTKNEEDRRVNAHLSQRLDSLGNQITFLYEYAQGKFAGLDTKSDLILEYVEKMCSKEYYEEMSNALGTDINKAIVQEMEAGYSNFAALNATGISQILAAIDDLKNNTTNSDGQVDVPQLEKTIQRENVQLSGQITGLQSLIESNNKLLNSKMDENHRESLSLLRIIIKQQDEIKATTLAGAGLNMNRHDFEKIYRGRIPSRFLYNEGFGGPFPCPYCGAEEERMLNEDQYCRCSICKNRFLAVDPFLPQEQSDGKPIEEILKQDFGRRVDDSYIVTKDKIEKWRNEHTAKVIYRGGSRMLSLTDNSQQDKLVILPEELGEVIHALLWYEYKDVDQIETLIFPSNIIDVAGLDFSLKAKSDVNYIYLKNIVFACDEQGRYSLKPNQRLTVSREINVYGKYSNGKNIKLNII